MKKIWEDIKNWFKKFFGIVSKDEAAVVADIKKEETVISTDVNKGITDLSGVGTDAKKVEVKVEAVAATGVKDVSKDATVVVDTAKKVATDVKNTVVKDVKSVTTPASAGKPASITSPMTGSTK